MPKPGGRSPVAGPNSPRPIASKRSPSMPRSRLALLPVKVTACDGASLENPGGSSCRAADSSASRFCCGIGDQCARRLLLDRDRLERLRAVRGAATSAARLIRRRCRAPRRPRQQRQLHVHRLAARGAVDGEVALHRREAAERHGHVIRAGLDDGLVGTVGFRRSRCGGRVAALEDQGHTRQRRRAAGDLALHPAHARWNGLKCVERRHGQHGGGQHGDGDPDVSHGKCVRSRSIPAIRDRQASCFGCHRVFTGESCRRRGSPSGLSAFLCCSRGPTPANSRGAPPPGEDRASGGF